MPSSHGPAHLDRGRPDAEPLVFPAPAGRLGRDALPAPLTPLIGRVAERADVRRLLERGTRLVTVTGPGGIGKTRVALHLAHDLRRAGVAVTWVSLAATRDAEGVVAAIAEAVGCPATVPGDAMAGLVAALRGAPRLLVLDNLEQVPAAGEPIAELLVRCPGLTILATSRARLRVSGEHLVPLRPLGLPRADLVDASLDAVAESEAVQLFAARARAVDPLFALDAETAPLVVQACRQVDALPLAIELAAARLAHLDLRTLVDQLSTRLPLLGGGNQDLPARQRTLRDTIAWSLDLLSPQERMVFRRLAVFDDGFTLWAAHAVCLGEDGEPLASAIEMLGNLADKSLIQRHPASQPHVDARYDMLETVREFALEQAAAREDLAALRVRHARWYRDFVQENAFSYNGVTYERDLARLGADWANISAAIRWFAMESDGNSLLRMGTDLLQAWHARGHTAAEIAVLSQALATASDAPPALRSRGLIGLAYLIHRDDGAEARATRLAAEGLAIERGLGDGPRLFEALVINAVIAAYFDALDRADGFAIEALDVAATFPDPTIAERSAGDIHHLRAGYARRRGAMDRAFDLESRALALGRATGDRWVELDALLGLGRLAAERGDRIAAIGWYRQSFRHPWPTGNPIVDALTLAGIAWTAVLLGRPEDAARLLGAASGVLRQGGINARLPLDADPIALAEAHVRAAIDPDTWRGCWAEGMRWSDGEVVQSCLSLLAVDLPMPQPDRPHAMLTRREADILPLLAQGLTHRAIGERLFIGERTVDSHVGRLFAKLDVHSRAEALSAARALGLLPD